jgi:hypothetical protein
MRLYDLINLEGSNDVVLALKDDKLDFRAELDNTTRESLAQSIEKLEKAVKYLLVMHNNELEDIKEVVETLIADIDAGIYA